MKQFFYLLTALLIISCNRSERRSTDTDMVQNVNTIDTIQLVNNFDPNFDFFFTYVDSFGDFIDFSKVDTTRKMITEMPYLELTQSLTSEPVFWLRKGESYHIIGESNHIPLFQCATDTSMNEAVFFNKLYENKIDLVYSFFNPDWKQIKKELDENVYSLKAKERYEKKLAYLEEQKQNLSPYFYDLCTHFFKIDYLNKLFYSYHRNENDESIKRILLSQKDSIQYDDLLFSKKYRDFCRIYSLFLSEIKSDSSVNTRYSIIKQNFSGKTRDYLLFETIKSHNPDENQLAMFYFDCNDETYKDYIKQELKAKTMLQSTNDSLLRTNLTIVGLSDLLSNYKGKWIYMDFWASWCAPCRDLFPASLKLKDKYGKDIIFVYISIDENTNQWQKALKYEKLDENHCFLLSKNSDFVKKHKIKSIPRYMLFDKNGILVDDNALRPDDNQWDEKIKMLVNKSSK